MTAYRRNVIMGSAALGTLLAALVVPNFRRGAASLAHPDPVGPTAYSKSAIGHAAFYNLLGELGIDDRISEAGSGEHVGPGDVLLIAEPRSDDATLDEVRAMLTTRTVLLVLPKRTGKPDPKRPYWLVEDKLLSDNAIGRVLHLVDKDATLQRDAAAPAGASIRNAQVIHSKKLRPLLASNDGIFVGELRTGDRRLVVLSDPDLISNHGLTHGDNAVIAVKLIEDLRGRHGDVIFDEFIHGFSPKPFHLLGILFQFPFVLVTVQMALAVALLAWAATARFGAPLVLAPPIDAGKRSLIDTGASLFVQTGRMRDLSERYVEEMVRDVGRTAGALSVGKPTTPQQAWTWRKELLGESRPHTKLD